MRNIFDTIDDFAVPAMEVLGLSLLEVREPRLSLRATAKRALLFCYLHYELGYKKSEVAFYTHKEDSTVGQNLKTRKKLWEENREELLTKITRVQL